VPHILVYNKIEKLVLGRRVSANRSVDGRSVRLSAVTGEVLPALLVAIAKRLPRRIQHGVMHLQPAQGRQRAKLFAMGAVLREEACEDGGWNIELRLGERDLQRFLQQENLVNCFLQPLPESVAAINH